MIKRRFLLVIGLLVLATSASAQKAEVTVSLNEPFFDALLDSIYQNFDAPQFPISNSGGSASCSETVKILREGSGARTSVRFREGKIHVPLAFSGNYAPPFVGCVDFAGWAETNIDLEFDRENQRLIGRAKVLNVNLNGSGGYGGGMIAKMIQSSLDKKLNPIDLIRLDKLSASVPIQNSGSLRLQASSVRTEITNGAVNIVVAYQFGKGN
ncbi:MAG: hypothetical protein ACKVQW_02020 [Pyrinomonadaceae bacterium]